MPQEVRQHPTLNCLCRTDGAVYVFGNPCNHAAHWTFGSKRGPYPRVTVGNRSYSVHRLVCETFHPNPDGKETVDHINRIKHDNRAENLRWATRSENQGNRKYTRDGKFGIGGEQTEFTVKYRKRFGMLKRDNRNQYEREHRFYQKHGFCSWEV